MEAERLWREGERLGDPGLLDRALALDPSENPNYVTRWGERALAWARANQFGKVRPCLERALAHDPQDLESWLNLGCLHLRAGNAVEAIAALESATRLAPADERGWGYLANAYSLAGRYQETLATLERVAPSPFASMLGGEAAVALGRWEQAVTALESVLPDAPQVAGLLAQALRGRNAGLEDCVRACQLDPDAPAGWVQLGQSLSLQGRWEAAVEAFDRALAMVSSYDAVSGKVAALAQLGREFDILTTLSRAQRMHGELKVELLNRLQAWLKPRLDATVVKPEWEERYGRRAILQAALEWRPDSDFLRLTEQGLEVQAFGRPLIVKVGLTSTASEVLEVRDRREIASSPSQLPPLLRPQLAAPKARKQYVPELKLVGADGGEHFGGQPWGLPLLRWPLCRQCGRAQSFHMQLDHCPPRLDLGASGRRVFVFQCDWDPGECETWEPFSGASAVVLLEPAELTTGPTTHPESPPEGREVLIADWLAVRDRIPAKLAPKYLDRELYHDDDAREHQPDETTRLGGSPLWIVDPEPPDGYRFAGQFTTRFEFWDAPPAGDEDVQPHSQGFIVDGPNYGGGVAYLFLKPPEGVFFWQC